MIAANNSSGQKNTVSAKAERTTAQMVLHLLLDIRNDKQQIFKYKLFYIFNNNTIAVLQRELGAFMAEIESLVFVP